VIGPQFDAIARAAGVNPVTARWILIAFCLAGCILVVGVRLASL